MNTKRKKSSDVAGRYAEQESIRAQFFSALRLGQAFHCCGIVAELRGKLSTVVERLPECSRKLSTSLDCLPECSGRLSTVVEPLPECSDRKILT
jgi:hypothetical protein